MAVVMYTVKRESGSEGTRCAEEMFRSFLVVRARSALLQAKLSQAASALVRI
jgi:hypothetical protein